MELLEVEVKFYLTDVRLIRNKIINLGVDSSEKVFETNVRFDDINDNLIQRKSLLRLRRDDKTTLTYKSEPETKDKNFKVLRELEVIVSNFNTTRLILESLGYYKKQIYEKWRETFKLDGIIFCIDTMPYGNFLEIEGNKKNIKNFAIRIGLNWGNRILFNYLEMFDILKNKMSLPFSDITFNNFKTISMDFSKYRHLFEFEK